VRARILVAATALAVLAWPLAYLVGGRLSPARAAAAGAGAGVTSVDVAADAAGACTIANLLTDSPATLYFGIHASGLRAGTPVTLTITGPDGSHNATLPAPPTGRSGCGVAAVPASVDHAQVWASGDYSVEVEVGSPPAPSGPVTAFNIAAGIADD
jgi:hypothetical protein